MGDPGYLPGPYSMVEDDVEGFVSWYVARLGVELARDAARRDARVHGDLHERAVYTCGPGAYMSAVREMLDGLGYDMAGYREESFVFPTTTPAALAGSPAAAERACAGPASRRCCPATSR